MSTDIQIFTNQEFNKTIRAIEIDSEPWFVGKDVAEALGYSDIDQALRKHVDNEDKRVLKPVDLTGLRNNANLQIVSPRGLIFINEAGLYSLVMSSKLPNAKVFKRWVVKEVLPQIRKTGSYSVQSQKLTPEFARQLINQWEDAERRAKENLNARMLQDCATKNRIGYNLGKASKCLNVKGLGRNKLFRFLRDIDILFYDVDGYNSVKQSEINNKRFFEYFDETYEYPVINITPKGMRYVLQRLVNEGYRPLVNAEEWERKCQEMQEDDEDGI